MTSNDLCGAIWGQGEERVRQSANIVLACLSFLCPGKTMRRVCSDACLDGLTYPARREILAGIRHRMGDRKLRAAVRYAIGVVPANLDRFMAGKQGQNGLRMWSAMSVFGGSNGIALAPQGLRLLFGFCNAVIVAAQNFSAAEHSDHKDARRSSRRPALLMDHDPIVEGGVIDAMTVHQGCLLLSLCLDPRLHREFARAVVRGDDQALHRCAGEALDPWLDKFAEHEYVRRGFEALARDGNSRMRFISISRQLFHWPAVVAYRAIEPMIEFIPGALEGETVVHRGK
jgi:hypothetical protein